MHWLPLPPGDIPGSYCCQELSQLQGHCASGRIKSMKIPSDPVGNQTRDLVAYSTVAQPTIPPHTSSLICS
jgi:hypothetical protein